MEKDFELIKVVPRCYRNIKFINSRPIPGYTNFYKTYVHYKYNGQHFRYLIYSVYPEPIDYEGSLRSYYQGILDLITEDIYALVDISKNCKEFEANLDKINTCFCNRFS